MTDSSDRFKTLQIPVNPDHPELLTGLETWLQLGLLSPADLQHFCQTHLVCVLPQTVGAASEASTEVTAIQRETQAESSDVVYPPVLASDFVALEPTAGTPDGDERSPRSTQRQKRSPRPAAPPNRSAQLLQSLMAEISVLWLLFLGVFLVVVSSAVLAATQWRNFPPVGQYAILLTYTLAFWGATLWTRRQEALRLTARMLRVATLLIIPVNFWMIDALRLWQGGAGLLVGAIATIVLTLTLVSLLRSSASLSRLSLINAIALSWLHGGWNLDWMPLLATYIGLVGTAAILVRQVRGQSSRAAATSSPQTAIPPETPVLIAMALLLLARAVLAAGVPLGQVGLALGICGWLFGWLALQRWQPTLPATVPTTVPAVVPTIGPALPPAEAAMADPEISDPTEATAIARPASLWGWLSVGFLLVGWAVTVSDRPPLQALAISGLACALLAKRLQKSQQPGDLTGLFIIGLQAIWLLGAVVPEPLRQVVVDWVTRWGSDRALPDALVGVLAFPYLWLWVASAQGFRQREQLALTQRADGLALILGGVLTLLSWENSLLRSLNLLLSALTLVAVVRWRSPSPRWMVYLTHLTVVAAAIAWIRFLLPNLPDFTWACLLLMGVVVEWALCLGYRHPQWRHSAWHVGLGLAASSYWLLLGAVNTSSWGLVWLLVPTLLTLLSYRSSFREPLLAIWLSVTGVFLLQLLNVTVGAPWMLSLGAAAGLMLVNTPRMASLAQIWEPSATAFVTIGFCLGFVVAVLDHFIVQWSVDQGALVLAIAPLLLWLVWQVCNRSTSLHSAYRIALEIWAIALSAIALLLGSGWILSGYLWSDPLPAALLWAVMILTGALAFRLWRQPRDWVVWGLGWSVELLMAAAIARVQGGVMPLAIATLALALIFQLGGDFWVRRSGRPYRSSGHGVPLGYAVLGGLLAHTEFSAYTGLYTLAVAAVGMGVGRRHPHLHGLSYLSVGIASTAAYELLIYQLLQAEGGQAGDGVVLLSGLAVVLAAAYRWGDRLLLPYLKISRNGLRTIAHLHWLLGTLLLIIAILSSLSPAGERLWIAVCTLLAIYALLMGRREEAGTRENGEPTAQPQSPNPTLPLSRPLALWTYTGILQALVALGYGLYQWVPDWTLLNGWLGAIATLTAALLYGLPWQRWGWLRQPWQRSALVLPVAIALCTAFEVRVLSLLVAAAFYAWVAFSSGRVRLSYWSVLLLDWAILRFLGEQQWLNALWFATLVGATLLYGAQVDPAFQSHSQRQQRHGLRCLATGIICLAAFYQSEVVAGNTALLTYNLLALGCCLAFVLLGLWRKVRAFLYIGTLAFVLKVLRQLWLFLNTDSLLLWAIGIVLGLVLIWIAATFEARRSQVSTLVEQWTTELQAWQ